MQTRPFGSTGITLPFLGLGCQRLIDTANCPEAEARRILEAAFAGGVRYFDAAWVYGMGQAEERLGGLARSQRAVLWIATKSAERTRDGALRQLEQSLARLQTDHVDEWRLHNLESLDDLEQCFQPDGAIHAAIQAKEQGLARAIGVSGHTHPQVLSEALRRFPFDSVMFPASALDHFIYSFEDEFLAQAKAAGAATVAMKALGLGKLSHLCEGALRYTLGLPVSMTVLGCSKLEELEKDLRLAEAFVPLDEAERQALLQAVQPLVTPRNVPWKAQAWGKTGKWLEPVGDPKNLTGFRNP
jgi:uncharacterized protein